MLRQKDLPAALAEAQQAEQLARDSATVNATFGQVLDANGRSEEAKPYYQTALTLAKTVEPAFQSSSIIGLEQRLSGKQR